MTVRVLLVDDVDDFRRLVAVALRVRGGFDVVGEASDGEGAIAGAARLTPDVVVLDLGLPDLAGTEVIARIRERSPASSIVVFTGSDVDDSLVPHVEGVVGKNADVTFLVDVVSNAALVTTPQGGLQATVDLPRDRASARAARQFVEHHCLVWRCESVLDQAAVVVSELVTNAVVHASSQCRLTLLRTATAFRIEVTDAGTGSPDVLTADAGDEHGRGLLLVSAMTAAWGVETVEGGGKTVWGELPFVDDDGDVTIAMDADRPSDPSTV